MSRVRLGEKLQLHCFPRVSGDEPGPEDLDKVLLVFSPRERG